MNQSTLFKKLSLAIQALQKKKDKPLRIAINGIEGTGKTTFAIHLTQYLKDQLQSIYHVSIDNFHFNKAIRYKQGRDSAKGYYEDSHDEIGFVEKVLLSSQKTKPYFTSASHDLETDKYLKPTPTYISTNSIIITDGAYLFKANYIEHWDLKIYLKTDFETALNRGIERDKILLGGKSAAKEKFLKRYHKASNIYIKDNQPESLADIIIDNTDFENLSILKWKNSFQCL